MRHTYAALTIGLTLFAAVTAFSDDLLPLPPGASAPAPGPVDSPPPAAPAAPNPAQQQLLAAARSACAGDIQKLCPSVQPGGGRILACLKQHKDQVSDPCKQAVVKVLNTPQ